MLALQNRTATSSPELLHQQFIRDRWMLLPKNGPIFYNCRPDTKRNPGNVTLDLEEGERFVLVMYTYEDPLKPAVDGAAPPLILRLSGRRFTFRERSRVWMIALPVPNRQVLQALEYGNCSVLEDIPVTKAFIFIVP